jgi:CheY-like chemotaxis protein
MGQAKPFRSTVLIVEDDDDQRFLASTLFEESKLEVIECTSAEAALAVIEAKHRAIAMVFTDIRLAGKMDGVELVHNLRQGHPEIPVIATSGDGHRARELPEHTLFLQKPWRPLELLMKAERVRIAAAPGDAWRGDIL